MAFGAKVKLAVDSASASKLAGEIQKAVDSAAKQNFTIKINKIDASGAINDLRSQLTTMLSGLKISGVKEFLGTEGVSEAYKAAQKAAEAQVNARANVLKTLQGSIDSTFKRGNNITDASAVEHITQEYNALCSKIEEAKSLEGEAFRSATTEINQKRAALQAYINTQAQAAKQAAQGNKTEIASLQEVSRLYKQISTYAQKNPRVMNNEKFGSDLQGYINTLEAGTKGTTISKAELNGIKEGFDGIVVSARKAKLEGKSLGDIIASAYQKFGGWMLVTQSMTKAIHTIKQMISTVKELDTAMTELRKVSDLTDLGYDQVFDKAIERAKTYGATVADTITATADFSRLGYGIEDATKLADASIVYKNVGDGIENITEASESIISTMKAFGIEATDSMQIVDKFNEVGNHFAISSKGIGDALQRSASALAAAGNTIDESIGLAVGMNTVLQDPQKVGTVLKTASMYLRAAKTDAEAAGEATDGMANSVSELRDELLTLTKGRVDIMQDETTFKSTVQIYRELAAVWKDLADIDQANILELIGGKRNSTANAALLQNFKDVEAAIQTAANSSGSALAENEKQLASIEGKISLFKAAFQGLSAAMFPTDAVKGFVDAGTGLLNFLTSAITALGGFGNTLAIIGIAIAALRFDKAVSGIVLLSNSFRGLHKILDKSFISSLIKVRAEMSKTGKSFEEVAGVSVGKTVATLGVMAVATGIAIWNAYQQYRERQRQEAMAAGNEAAQEAKTITDAYQKYADANYAYESNTGSKEALTSATNSLLSALGMEGVAIQALIDKYGSLDNAIKEVTADSLRQDISDMAAGVNAAKEEFVEAAKRSGDSSTLNLPIYSKLNSFIPTKNGIDFEAMEELRKHGYKIDLSDRGMFTIDFGDIVKGNDYEAYMQLMEERQKVRTILENGLKQGKWTRQQLDNTAIYTEMGKSISKVATQSQEATDEVSKMNAAIAELQYLELDDSLKTPKTQSQFEKLQQTLINAAMASNEFSGSQEDAKNAVLSFLQTQDRYSQFFQRAAALPQGFDEDSVLQGLKDWHETTLQNVKDEYAKLSQELYGDEVGQNYNPFFGNLNLNDRQVLQWTDDNLNKYKDALMSWARDGQTWDDIQKEFQGSISTVFGLSGEYDGIEIAFSPMLQTENGAELLSRETVDNYISSLIDKAGEGWTNEQLLQLDTEGLEIDGQYIKNLIADIGDTARQTGEIMHYMGADGAIKQYEQEVKSFSEWIDKLDADNRNLVYEIALTTNTDDWDLQTWNTELENLKDNTDALDVLHAKASAVKDALAGGSQLSIETETEGIENVQKALEATSSAIGLTKENISALTERYGELEGFDAGTLFTNTATGVMLNADALSKLEDEYQKVKNAYNDTLLEKQVERYNELTDTINELLMNENDLSKLAQASTLLGEQSALADEIERAAQLTSQYGALTSAYNEWVNAKSGVGTMYDTVTEGFESMQELYKKGYVGDERFKKFAQLMSYDDLSGASMDEIVKAYERGTAAMHTYFTDGAEGAAKFLNYIKSLNTEDKTWLEQTGDKEFTFNFDNDELAQKLGVSKDLVKAMIDQLGRLGWTIKFDSITDNLDLTESGLTEINNKLKETGKISKDIDFSATGKNLDEEIKQISNVLDGFRGEDGKINLKADGAQEASIALAALIARKQELEKPAVMSIDTSKLVDASAETVEVVSTIQELVQAQNNLEVAKSIGLNDDQVQAAQTSVDTLVGKLQGLAEEHPQVFADLQITDTSAEGLRAAIEGMNIESLKVKAETDEASVQSINNTTFQDLKQTVKRIADPVSTARINSFTPTTVYQSIVRTVTEQTSSKKSGSSPARGTAFAHGTWGTKGSGIALGGELGQELVVRDGRFFTIGDDSAEFFRYKKGDIIFNAEQTKQIFEKGKITWGNRRGVRAMADGTAFDSGSGWFYGGASKYNSTVKTGKASSTKTSNKSNNNKSSSSDTEKALEEELKKMQEAIKKTIASIEHQIFIMGKLAEPGQPDSVDIIDLYTQAMDAVHEQAEAYRAKGLDENSEYIQEMQKQWWEFHDKIAETISDAYEKARERIENSIELVKIYAERNFSAGNFDAAEQNISQIISYYDALKDSYHEQAEELRGLGYTDDSNEVSELMQDWAKAHTDAIETVADAYENLRKHIENAVTLNTIWQGRAIDNNDYRAVKEYTDKIIEYQKQMQESLHEQAEYYRAQGYADTSDEISKLMEAWNDCQEEIVNTAKESYQALVDYANDAVDKIQDLYSKLKDAAKEFAESGYVTVDAFQAIIELGVEYMGYLKNENGLLVINRDRINQMIAAKTEQLAITTALNYVEQLSTAVTTNNIHELERLLNVKQDINSVDRDYVYSLLRMIGLDETYYKQALEHINILFSLYDSVADGIGRGAEDGSSKYGDMKDALDDILDLVMELIKYESEQRVKALEEQIDKYKEIIDLKKESLKTTKEENDYNKQLTSKVKQMAELQERIARLSLDDSREAQAERISLEKELAELQEDTADYQADYAYDRTVDMLDDEYDAYEKAKQKQIEREKETVSSTQKVYELAIQRIEEEWDTLFDDIIAWNYEAGSRIESEIIDKWKLAIEAVKEYGSFVKAVNHFNEVDSKSESDDYNVVGNYTKHQDSGNYAQDNNIKNKMKQNSIAYAVAGAINDASQQGALMAENRSLAKQLSFKTHFGNDGVWYDTETNSALYQVTATEVASAIVKLMKSNSSQWTNANASRRSALDAQNSALGAYVGQLLKENVYRDNDGVWWIGNSHLYDKYHTGGVVGHNGTTKDNEILALLEKGEVVLNDSKKNGLYRVMDIASYMIEKFGAKLDGISGLGSIVNKPIANTIGELRDKALGSLSNITDKDITYTIESVEVNAPVQVLEKLDESAIREHARTIGTIAEKCIREGFTKRGVGSPASLF